MRKKLYLIILLSFNFLYSNAQVFDLKEGNPARTDSKPVKIIGQYNNHIVSISVRKGNYYIVQYDLDSLKPVAYKALKLTYHSQKLVFMDVINLLGTNYIFSFYSNPESKKASFLYQEIDLEKLELIGEAKLWSESYLPISHQNKGFFISKESMDGSKKVIINSLNSNSKTKSLMMISVYDSTTSSFWQDKVEVPFNLKHFKLSDAVISDNGSVFIFGKKYKNEKFSSKKNLQNYQHLFLSYHHETKKLYSFPFEFETKQILNLRMAMNAKQQLILAAVTYEQKDSNYYYIETYVLDEQENQFNFVDKNEINFYTTYNESVKAKKAFLPNVVCHNMERLKGNNSFVFATEQRIITHSYYVLPPINTYAYLQSAVVIIDSTAHIVRQYEIKKRQTLYNNTYTRIVTDDDYYDPIITSQFSYVLFTNQSSFYYLYNEEKKNIQKKKWNQYYIGRPKTAYPFICYANAKTNLKYFPLNTNKETTIMLYLNTYYKKDDDLFIFAQHNQDQVLLKIKIRDNLRNYK